MASEPVQHQVPQVTVPHQDITPAQMQQDLLDFVTQRNFEEETQQPLTTETLISPTQQEFESIFQFLYHQLDQIYVFSKRITDYMPVL